MNNLRLLIASFLIALPLTQAQATLITPARLGLWSSGSTVGVPGGIPTTRTNIVDVTKAPYNADPTGATDCQNAILAAINAATSGEVIYLPAGTYLVNETIFPNQGKSNYTIRGAGDSTVINWMGTSGELFYLGSGSDYLWNYPAGGVSITGGLSQGSTVLTVASTSAVIDGGIIQITENNDTTLPVVHVSGYQNKRSQKAQVLSHTATTITLSSGLLWTLQSSLNPVFNVAQYQSNGVGIENMFVNAGNSTSSYVIAFDQCYGSWIYNVHTQLAYNYHIFLMDCLQCQVDHCYLDQLNHIGTNGAGLIMQGTSNSLIQNNIITKAAPHMEINFGSSGNVFAYNFCYDSSSFGVVGPSIDTNHGPHNSYNLYEGNVAPNIQCDGFFGSASEDTVLRNWLFGTAPEVFVPGSSTVLAAREPLLLQRFTRNYNVVGNLLGTKGTPYYSVDSTVATGSPYSFGMPNIGNSTATGTAQLSTGNPWKDWDIQGTLTSTSSANAGVVTVNSTGDLSTATGQASITWAGGIQTNITILSVSGNTVSFSGGGGSASLPAVGTAIQIWPGPGGYQEKDLDVQATVDLKANYDVSNQVEPSADQALGTDTVPNSLYLAAAPSWFGSLAWPAVNAASPYTSNIVSGATGSTGLPLGFESIPAGYRYVHGEDPPTASATPSFTGQPASASVTVGGTTSFIVVAQGSPTPALQWEVSTNGGTAWTALANGGVYSGVTTSILTITGATASLNGYQYNCIATNSTAPGSATSNSAVLTVTVPAATASPPVITSPTTAAGTQNSPFAYSIAATNSPASYSATGLPSGLLVNTTTGAITGTPTAGGSASITISATNAGGTGWGTLYLTIGAATGPVVTASPPVITSPTTANGTQNSPFAYSITATNSPTSYSATGLPSGLLVNNTTGAITGTPTVDGIFGVTIGATNAGGTGSATLNLTIGAAAAPVVTTNLPVITSSTTAAGTQSSPFAYSITATNSPTSYSATGLPSGLLVNTTTGAITGTPTATGSASVTISATNSSGTGWGTVYLTIAAAARPAVTASPPVITSPTTATGTQNSPFTYSITATNSPTSYSATGLPSGLWVNNTTGTITGTPTAIGSASVTISATNSGGSGWGTLYLTIGAAANPPSANSTTGTPPAFTQQPTSQTVASGRSAAFDAMATGTPAPTYQWRLNGTPISGGTDAILLVSGTTSASTGTYTCAATNSAGTVVSNAAVLSVTQTSSPGYLANLSARGYVGSGAYAMTGGFGITGNGSKQMLLRGVGPGLNYISGLTGYVPNPQMTLYNSAQTPIDENDQWGGTLELINAFNSVGAFPLSPTSLDTALYLSLAIPGSANFTVSVSSGSDGPGTGLVEVYDADSSAPSIRLVNISSRALVETGQSILIGGFGIGGTTAETVLIRGIGPTLGVAPFNIPGTLAQPVLTVYSGNTPICSNTEWGGDPTISTVFGMVGAFPLQSDSQDSALLVTLPPGGYTAEVSGVDASSGIALVEVYEVY